MFHFHVEVGQLVDWLQLLATILGFYFVDKTLRIQFNQFQFEKSRHKAAIKPWFKLEKVNLLLPEKSFTIRNKGGVARTIAIIHPNNTLEICKHLETDNDLTIQLRLPSPPYNELLVFLKYNDNESNTYSQEFKIKEGSSTFTDPVEVK